MRMSEQVDKLFAALVAAQSSLLSVKADSKGSVGQGRDYRYASLEAVLEETKIPLQNVGLAITQFPDLAADGMVGLETILVHNSGQWMGCSTAVPLVKKDPQGYGSALTYARRYGLMAVLGLATDDDDGVNGGQQPKATKPTPTKATQPSNPPTPDPDPKALIDALVDQLKSKGLGPQAAQVTTKYSGYGKNLDEQRQVYKELRALLTATPAEPKSIEGGQINSLQSSCERIFKIPKGEAGSDARAKIWGLAFLGGEGTVPTNTLTFDQASWLLTKGLPHIEGQFKLHKTPINERLVTLETLVEAGQTAFEEAWEV